MPPKIKIGDIMIIVNDNSHRTLFLHGETCLIVGSCEFELDNQNCYSVLCCEKLYDIKANNLQFPSQHITPTGESC